MYPTFSVVVEVASDELALAESASHERLSNGIDVIVLLHESLVHGEAGEAKLVESLQGLLELGAALSLDSLEVELLGRLGADADRAAVQEAAGGGGLLVFNSHLLVVSVLSHHLDRLLSLVLLGWLAGLNHDLLRFDNFSLRLDAKDVTGNLVAELDPTRLQAEEGAVAALLLWSLALNRNLEGLVRLYFTLDRNDLGADVVSASLEELGAGGPGSLAVVAHPPRLAEDVASDDLVLVREALLDEASGVAHVLLGVSGLGRGGVALPEAVDLSGRLWLLGWLGVVARVRNGLLTAHVVPVLADKLLWGLMWLADLYEWELRVGTGLLTDFAEVSIRSNGIDVANTDDWGNLASITDDTFVHSRVLFDLLLV